MRLEGKVALITGGASGIGRATALLFAREGAEVAIVNRSMESGREAAAEIVSKGWKAEAVQADVSKAEDVRRAVECVIDRFGAIDVLFNCAGTHFVGQDVGCHETDEDVWDRTLAVNLTGTFLACKYVLPHMIEAGGGSIINVSSISGIIGRLRNSAYAASKGGVIALTKSLAIDYLAENIRANVIIPGRVDTPLMRRLFDDPTTPRELDCGVPDDVGYCALYLASDESKFVTGAEFVVDHGVSAR
jgi:NAD(P)-dependent dehydrogenase (short-subunit alcohol dehydrogenase family)